jgi:hypothetical protein
MGSKGASTVVYHNEHSAPIKMIWDETYNLLPCLSRHYPLTFSAIPSKPLLIKEREDISRCHILIFNLKIQPAPSRQLVSVRPEIPRVIVSINVSQDTTQLTDEVMGERILDPPLKRGQLRVLYPCLLSGHN